jgi:pimeloyl-ACP methyl ester carboxylesterase
MSYLQLTPDTQLYYEISDWTDPWTTPETVVLIHGFTESTEAWRPWVPHLARRYRVIRYDQHGFGRSSAVTPTTEFTTEGFVEAAARMIATAGAGPAHVIGAKSGGLVAIELARSRPELVKTLTLASVPLDPPQPEKWMAHMEAHGVESWARETMPPRLGSRMPPEGVDWWVKLMGGTAIETARVYMRWVSRIDVGRTLDEVKCPALVLTTTTPRRAYSRSDIDVYREKLPQAGIVALPGDGYHVGASDPDECAALTLDFLAKHGRSNPTESSR